MGCLVEEKIQLAKVLLKKLDVRGPMRYTDLLRTTYPQFATPTRYRYLILFLLSREYVKKRVEGRKAWLEITERGRQFLQAI